MPTNSLEETTRHWTFTVSTVQADRINFILNHIQAFEWIVHDVSKLKEFVESAVSDKNDAIPDEFEILKESPLLDGKFKLEIGKNIPL